MKPYTDAELQAAADALVEHDASPERVVALAKMRRARAQLTAEAAERGLVDGAAIDRAMGLYGPEANVTHVLRLVEIAREHEASEQADRDARDAWLREYRALADKLFVGWMLMQDPRQFSHEEFETLCADLRARAEEAAALRRAY